MKEYYYSNGTDPIGPFSLNELKKQDLTRETKIWFDGLDDWTNLKEIDELKNIGNSIVKQRKNASPKYSHKNKYITIIILISLAILWINYTKTNKHKSQEFYHDIFSSAYETDIDFDVYIKKFYRDIEVYGLFPKKPEVTIIKFAKLDKITNGTHIHGISYGVNNDKKIEIYINPSTWEKFNKSMRYYLMYHELAHDILNVDDLENSPENEGKLMFPAIATYELKTMDDFIENSHDLFEEISAKY